MPCMRPATSSHGVHLQKRLHPGDIAGVRRHIAGKTCDSGAKIRATHDLENALHGLGIEERALADEEIIFGENPDEIEAELPSGSLDTKTRIRHAACDIGRDRGMGELDL